MFPGVQSIQHVHAAEAEAQDADVLLPPPPRAPGTGHAEEATLCTFVGLYDHDSVHHCSLFLDRYDFAALNPICPAMQENARKIIRARNERLPVGKRMANLEGPFRVSVAVKELLKREGRHLLDMIDTGGFMWGQSVNTVMSLGLVTKRYTALAPMITARMNHGAAALGGNIFVAGGESREVVVGTSVESFDPATNQWTAVTPMNTGRCYHGLMVWCQPRASSLPLADST